MADIYPESRVEEILVAMINGEEYTKFPESRIEALLIELLGKIIEVEGRGAYEFKGSVDFDELPETLTEDMAGWTYNMAESFTTDSRFVDGSGKSYPQGTNVSVANVGTDEEPDMMFDVPSAFVDVSAIYNTIHTVVANLASIFSDQIAYHTGDLVVKDDVLYKFTSDHAAGEWNPSHASTATLASLLIEVYTTITQVSNTIPTQLSQLTDDSTHRLVTDTEKIAWNGKQSALTFDSAPTEDSLNPVTSDGIFDALSAKQDILPLTVSGNDITTNGNLTANGHVLDGLGNDLALLGELGLSVDSEGYIIQTLEEEN